MLQHLEEETDFLLFGFIPRRSWLLLLLTPLNYICIKEFFSFFWTAIKKSWYLILFLGFPLILCPVKFLLETLMMLPEQSVLKDHWLITTLNTITFTDFDQIESYLSSWWQTALIVAKLTANCSYFFWLFSSNSCAANDSISLQSSLSHIKWAINLANCVTVVLYHFLQKCQNKTGTKRTKFMWTET